MDSNRSRTVAVRGTIRRLWRRVARYLKIKWTKVKNFVLRKKTNAVVTLLLTDETEDDSDTSPDGVVVTRVNLTVRVTSPDELEWVQRQFVAHFQSTRSNRDELLNHLIQLHYRLGVELEQAHTKADKIDIAASSVGIFSTILGTAGFGLAFSTFGTSLILSLTGFLIATASAGVTFAAHKIRTRAKKRIWKQLKASSDAFNEENERLLHIMSEAEYLGILTSGTNGFLKSPVQTVMKAIDVANADDFVQFSTIPARISKPLVKTLSTGGEVLFYGGFALSLVSAAWDTYTIVDRSKRLHSGQWSEQAQAYHDLAQTYERFRDSGQRSVELPLGDQ